MWRVEMNDRSQFTMTATDPRHGDHRSSNLGVAIGDRVSPTRCGDRTGVVGDDDEQCRLCRATSYRPKSTNRWKHWRIGMAEQP